MGHTIDAVKTPDGCVRLNEQTLSDGSVVYDICFYTELDVLVFTLCPASKVKAEQMFNDIRNSI